jgi:outer membrane assembly lipoprotein YfgL
VKPFRLSLRSALRSSARLVAAGLVATLLGCSSTPEKPRPAALPSLQAQTSLKQAWSQNLGPVFTSLVPSVQGQRVALASARGEVQLLDASSGQLLWRHALNKDVRAGLGGDGQRYALVTQDNEVVTLEAGQVLWRHRLPAISYTPPLVAGGRVFVLTADRTLTALDGASGRKLWAQTRTTDPLVLNRPGLLMALGDTLVAGLSGRLVGLNPDTGVVRWEVAVGNARGSNEIERLVDLLGGVHRQQQTLCVRSFQTSVACVDTQRAQILWTRNAQGHSGVDGDGQRLYGVESDGKVLAWNMANGQPAWTQDSLRFREPTAVQRMGQYLITGDASGLLHILQADSGQLVGRVSTGNSPVVLRPVLAGATLVVINEAGQVMGFRAPD